MTTLIKTLAVVAAGSVLATSAFAQSAREIRGGSYMHKGSSTSYASKELVRSARTACYNLALMKDWNRARTSWLNDEILGRVVVGIFITVHGNQNDSPIRAVCRFDVKLETAQMI